MVLRRMEIAAPNVAQDAVGDSLAGATDGAQGALGGSSKGGTIRGREWAAKSVDQGVDVSV
jgi:hypothetical protein